MLFPKLTPVSNWLFMRHVGEDKRRVWAGSEKATEAHALFSAQPVAVTVAGPVPHRH